MKRHGIVTVLILMGLAVVCGLPATAQESTPAATENGVTVDIIAAQRQRIDQAADLEAARKTRALTMLEEATAQLAVAEEWRAKTAEFDRLRESAPKTMEEVEAQLAAPAPAPEPPAELPATVAELDPMLREAEANLKAAQTALDDLTQELPRRSERRRMVPDLIVAAQQRLQEAQANIASGSGEDLGPYVEEAARLRSRARAEAAQAEITSYQQEMLSYEARSNLLTRRQELARRNLTAAQRRHKAIQDATIAARESEAAAAADRARKLLEEIGQQDRAIQQTAKQLAERNAELADMRTGENGLVTRITTTSKTLEEVRTRSKQLTDEMSRIQQRVAAAGLDEAVGLMLRRAKAELPDPRALAARIEDRREEIVSQEVMRIDLNEERLALGDMRDQIDAAIERLSKRYGDGQRKEFKDTLEAYFQQQRELLDAVYEDTERYLDLLFDLNTEDRQMLATTERFEEYINENILWVGGTAVMGIQDLREVYPALLWAMDPVQWLGSVPLLTRDLQRRWFAWFSGIGLVLVLLYARRTIKRAIGELGAIAGKRRHTQYGETLGALAYTIVLSVTIPSIFFVSSWLLGGALQRLAVGNAFAAGLGGVGFFLLILEFVRAILLRNGLAESHFSWSRKRIVPARRLLHLLEVGGMPFVFCSSFFAAQSNEVWQDSLGRLGVVVGLVAGAGVGYLLIRTLYRPLATVRRQTWPGDYAWTRFPAYFLSTWIPLGLAGLAVMGYFYTATQLSELLFFTNWLVLFVLLAVALARRWFLITRRHVAVEQARKLRAAAKAAPEDSDTPDVDTQEEAVDFVRVDAQTQRLIWSIAAAGLLVGLWFIWRDYVPALAALDYEVYTIQETVTELVENDQGIMEERTQPRQVPIKLSHFVLLGFVIIGTIVAVRNFPGFLELFLLKRLSMGAGERYALMSLVQYVIVGIGIVLCFNVVGIGWSNLQWLVAALGLGLGFGLQEIFANFISGVIILFERPIRLGDAVTVGDVSGTVTKIRIRATTITDFDRKELIVPNKEFITGKLVNWSLTDSVLRIRVPVGIAYGSDTEKAKELMLQVAEETSTVLDDPPPQAVFMAFGDSTLNFELRVFTDVDNFLTTIDAAHMGIDNAFRAAGIEIAFPQRDLHLRSGFEKLVTRADRAGNPIQE